MAGWAIGGILFVLGAILLVFAERVPLKMGRGQRVDEYDRPIGPVDLRPPEEVSPNAKRIMGIVLIAISFAFFKVALAG